MLSAVDASVTVLVGPEGPVAFPPCSVVAPVHPVALPGVDTALPFSGPSLEVIITSRSMDSPVWSRPWSARCVIAPIYVRSCRASDSRGLRACSAAIWRQMRARHRSSTEIGRLSLVAGS